MATKPTNEHKCIRVSYIINVVFLPYASATLEAILREVEFKFSPCLNIIINASKTFRELNLPLYSFYWLVIIGI